jgi:hypothetical protein
MVITATAVENSLVEIISADRASAWSRAANRVYHDVSAGDVIRAERLDYDVWKEPLVRNNGKFSGFEAVVARYKNVERVYGATKDYTIVHINSLIDSLNEIPYPVESALALNDGRFIAINYDYGQHTIVGEEYNLGLTIMHPYQPGYAWRMMITPVRLRCMNALIAAKRASVSDLRVWHRSQAPSKIDIAMLQSNAKRLELNMRDSLEGLATLYVAGREEKILHKVYGETAAGIVVANLYRRFENEYPEFRGTAYALYQATCEAEDYRPVRKNQTERIIAESALVGTRSMKKIQMFDTLVNMN